MLNFAYRKALFDDERDRLQDEFLDAARAGAPPRSLATALCDGESGQDLRRSPAAASPPYSLALAAPPRPAQPLRRPLRPRGVPHERALTNANDYLCAKPTPSPHPLALRPGSLDARRAARSEHT